jgi:hypothetical protein
MKLTIEQTIANMLTENTGTHMCDSGGSTGRNWQRNQGKNVEYFKSLPSATADIYYNERNDYYEIEPCVNIFHLLTSGVLELDELCHKFNSIEVGEWSGEYWGVCNSGIGFLNKHSFENIDNGFNTYNWCANHSQVMQGNMLERDDEKYILLQIHGGADVRGGYTDAKLFKLDDHADFYNVVSEDCGFGAEIKEIDTETKDLFDGRTHNNIISLDYHGEWINYEGGGADDDDIKAFAIACGCNAENTSITIEGYAHLDY